MVFKFPDFSRPGNWFCRFPVFHDTGNPDMFYFGDGQNVTLINGLLVVYHSNLILIPLSLTFSFLYRAKRGSPSPRSPASHNSPAVTAVKTANNFQVNGVVANGVLPPPPQDPKFREVCHLLIFSLKKNYGPSDMRGKSQRCVYICASRKNIAKFKEWFIHNTGYCNKSIPQQCICITLHPSIIKLIKCDKYCAKISIYVRNVAGEEDSQCSWNADLSAQTGFLN